MKRVIFLFFLFSSVGSVFCIEPDIINIMKAEIKKLPPAGTKQQNGTPVTFVSFIMVNSEIGLTKIYRVGRNSNGLVDMIWRNYSSRNEETLLESQKEMLEILYELGEPRRNTVNLNDKTLYWSSNNLLISFYPVKNENDGTFVFTLKIETFN